MKTQCHNPYLPLFEHIPDGEPRVFGDRLYTDIALGTRHGVTSVLVLTGETSESDLAAAPADERPDMVYDSLHETDLALFGVGKEAEHGI